MAGENLNISALSEYLRSLTVRDRDNYLKKLTLTDGTRLVDQYTITHWMDLTRLPPTEWPDIYTYLIEKPSVYSKEKLRVCKSLD